MRSLLEDIDAAASFPGHLCSGIVIGVRMARLALGQLGIQEPHRHRDLVVYVETDRCPADAIGVVTGCTLGRRRLKWLDYGKIAATFVDLPANRAIRVWADRERTGTRGDEGVLEYWEKIPDEAVVTVQPVLIEVPPEDRPGKPLRVARCGMCGERVLDGRESEFAGKQVCRTCANGAYYRKDSPHPP
ncbi:MAG: formylmethanofuran dehydrogenase [Chloroflexi bacterium]|nr:formylmethanofuran dehydrogenase [Chloroflexota bacterium]